MNTIEKSVIRHVAAFNVCIGPNDPQEFGWVADNIDDFRKQSIEIYQKLLAAFLTKTGMKLYVYELCKNDRCLREMPVDHVDLSFLDQCSRFIAVLSENEPSSPCFFENQTVFFEAMYEKGYTLFEIHDFFAEGNSMTFYGRDCEILAQLEEIAGAMGFSMIV